MRVSERIASPFAVRADESGRQRRGGSRVFCSFCKAVRKNRFAEGCQDRPRTIKPDRLIAKEKSGPTGDNKLDFNTDLLLLPRISIALLPETVLSIYLYFCCFPRSGLFHYKKHNGWRGLSMGERLPTPNEERTVDADRSHSCS